MSTVWEEEVKGVKGGVCQEGGWSIPGGEVEVSRGRGKQLSTRVPTDS